MTETRPKLNVRHLLDAELPDPPALVLINNGFLLYPVQPGVGCTDIAAPRVDLLPHAARLAFPQDSVVDISGALTHYVTDEVRVFEVTGLSMTIVGNPTAPATINHDECAGEDDPDFNWVSDFTSLCSGVRLNPNWAGLPAVDFRLRLCGGQLIADADDKSLSEKWKWFVNGVEHVQRVTSFTGYVTTFSSRTIRFDTLGGAPVGSVRLREGGEFPFIIGSLSNSAMTNPDGGKTIQFAHDVSFLNLCVPTGGPIALAQPTKTAAQVTAKSLPTRKKADPTASDHEAAPGATGDRANAVVSNASVIPGPDRESRDLEILLAYIANNVNLLYDGTPECSGHQMAV